MVISTNLIRATSGHKVNEFLMSNIYRYRSSMNNQTRYAKSAQTRGLFGNNVLIEFYDKKITFMTLFAGSQLTS